MVGSSTNVVRVDAFFAFKKSHKPKEPKILVSLPATPPPHPPILLSLERNKKQRATPQIVLYFFPIINIIIKLKKKCPTSHVHCVCLSSVRLSEDFFLFFFLFTFLYFLLPPPEFPYCLYYICPSSVSLLEFFFSVNTGHVTPL